MNALEMFDLTGKVAIVTGGTGIYGTPISEGLAEAGAKVIIASRNGEKCEEYASELRKLGYDVVGMSLDLGNDESIENFVTAVIERYNCIDILVNNAVTRDGYCNLPDTNREKLSHTLNINVVGTLLLIKSVIPYMQKQGSGSIINISSIQGVGAPHFPFYEEDQSSPLGYTFEKWGMIGYTKWLAAYYGKDNIRVTCISPGGFDPKLETLRPDFYRTYQEHTPLKRWPDKSDIKGPILFLASEASRYTTGINLIMDGGFTIW